MATKTVIVCDMCNVTLANSTPYYIVKRWKKEVHLDVCCSCMRIFFVCLNKLGVTYEVFQTEFDRIINEIVLGD
jgi:hypothetical protein